MSKHEKELFTELSRAEPNEVHLLFAQVHL